MSLLARASPPKLSTLTSTDMVSHGMGLVSLLSFFCVVLSVGVRGAAVYERRDLVSSLSHNEQEMFFSSMDLLDSSYDPSTGFWCVFTSRELLECLVCIYPWRTIRNPVLRFGAKDAFIHCKAGKALQQYLLS